MPIDPLVAQPEKVIRTDQESAEVALSHGDKKVQVEQEQELLEDRYGVVVVWLLQL